MDKKINPIKLKLFNNQDRFENFFMPMGGDNPVGDESNMQQLQVFTNDTIAVVTELKEAIADVSGTINHAELINLEYENSGHIGFASQKSLTEAVTELELKIQNINFMITGLEILQQESLKIIGEEA